MNADDIERTLRARAAFDASVDHVDADTRRRLRDMRQHALRPAVSRPHARWLIPGGAALATALVVAVVVPRLQHGSGAQDPAPIAHAPRAIAATAVDPAAPVAGYASTLDPMEDADPDMLSDLDFYGWLAKQPGTTGG